MSREQGMDLITHCYRANGLTIDSEIPLPELSPFAGEPDVVIRYGAAPTQLDGSTARGPCYQAKVGQCLFTVPGVARYWVRNGRDVTIAAEPGVPESDIRVFILSSVMGAVAHQQGFLAMHASTVRVDGRCVLFAGVSGAGKSTLAAAFHDCGHPLVGDDLCAISFDAEGRPWVQPGYRRVKLWADSLERVGTTLGERRKMRVGMRKYSVAIPGSAPLAPLPIAKLFILSNCLTERIELSPLGGRAKVTAIVKETFRRPMMTALGQREEHFRLCTALARCIPVAGVQRPFHLGELRRLVQTLEQDLQTTMVEPA